MELAEAFITLRVKSEIEKTLTAELGRIEKAEIKHADTLTKINATSENKKQSLLKYTTSVALRMYAIASAGAVLASVAYTKYMGAVTNVANEILNLNSISGVNVEMIQKMSNAYSVLGNISTERAQSELGALASKIARAKMGWESPLEMSMAGINFNGGTTVESAVNDLRKNLSGMSDAQALPLLEKIGLGKEFLPMLRATQTELETLNSIPILTKQQAQNIRDAGRGFDIIKKQLGGLIMQAQAGMATKMISSFKKFSEMITKNSEKIITFIKTFVEWTGRLATSIMRVTTLIFDMLHAITSASAGFKVLAGVIALMMLPLKPLHWMLIAIYLILDDIQTWRMGGDSFTGDIMKGWDNALKSIKSHFAEIVLSVASIVAGIIGAIAAFKQFDKALGGRTPKPSGTNNVAGAYGKNNQSQAGQSMQKPSAFQKTGEFAGGLLSGVASTVVKVASAGTQIWYLHNILNTLEHTHELLQNAIAPAEGKETTSMPMKNLLHTTPQSNTSTTNSGKVITISPTINFNIGAGVTNDKIDLIAEKMHDWSVMQGQMLSGI